ncbi:MAG: AAA family ATPase, partial [Nanoarchaeota archaeon]
MKPWTETHTPKHSKDVAGQDEAIAKIKAYLSAPPKHALLLYGPCGTGKTSSAHMLGAAMGFDVQEINASDTRNEKGIQATIGMSLGQQSLLAKKRLILIDEIEGLSGTYDRGGVPSIVKLIERSKHHIILTSIDIKDRKLKPLLKASTTVEFAPLGTAAMTARLVTILNAEKIKHLEDDVKMVARRSGGDMRAAINDLQAICADGTLSRADIEIPGERRQTEKMVQALVKVFKTTDAKVARGAFNDLAEDLDAIFLWMEYNMP